MTITVNIHAVGERLYVDAKTLTQSGTHVVTIRASEAQTVAVFFDQYVSRAKVDAIVEAFNAAYADAVPA